MNDSVYAPPKSDLTNTRASANTPFYVVSPFKMMVLFLATIGTYQLYWHYENWRLFKLRSQIEGTSGAKVWPVPRAVFSLFFVHALLRHVKRRAVAENRDTGFNSTLHASLMLLLMLSGTVLGNFPEASPYLIPATVIALILLVPTMFVYRAVQTFINQTCGDPLGAANDTFTVANYLWIAFGVLVWLGLAAGGAALLFGQSGEGV